MTVVIPTYNRNEYCKELLKSIVGQSYSRFEIIVIDDSGAKNPELEAYIDANLKSFDVQYVNNERNCGVQHCRNLGLSFSKYDYICFVDDDDVWEPYKLEAQIQSMNGSDFSLCYSDAYIIDDNGKVLEEWVAEEPERAVIGILRECFIPSPSIMLKKSILIDVGGFDGKFPSCQDWDAWTRVILSNPKIVKVSQPLVRYRKHQGEAIGTSKNAQMGYKIYSRKYLLLAIKNFNALNVLIHVRRALFGINMK